MTARHATPTVTVTDMPRGDARRVIRLSGLLLDRLGPEADAAGVTVAELIERRLDPNPSSPPPASRRLPVVVCECAKPDPTPYGVCKKCGRRRG